LVRWRLRLQLFDRHLRVRIDTDVAGNLKALHRDLPSAEIRILHQGARAGQRKTPPAPNCGDTLIRIDHVAIAGEQKRLLRISHNQQSFKLPQHLIRAPVLGKLDRSTAQITGILLKLHLESGKERKRIRS
jgi:hypothetical protein